MKKQSAARTTAILMMGVLSCFGATNPGGPPGTDCPRCAAKDGTATSSTHLSCESFEWSANVGLARYAKPTSYAGLGTAAYDRSGRLPSFQERVADYFPSGPLQQSQVPLRINQAMISAETFHAACLILDSEALFERLPKTEAGGPEYLHQIVTDDAISQVDLLAAGATPPGFGSPGFQVGAGWQIRIWKKPVGLTKSGAYYPAPPDVPLTYVCGDPDRGGLS